MCKSIKRAQTASFYDRLYSFPTATARSLWPRGRFLWTEDHHWWAPAYRTKLNKKLITWNFQLTSSWLVEFKQEIIPFSLNLLMNFETKIVVWCTIRCFGNDDRWPVLDFFAEHHKFLEELGQLLFALSIYFSMARGVNYCSMIWRCLTVRRGSIGVPLFTDPSIKERSEMPPFISFPHRSVCWADRSCSMDGAGNWSYIQTPLLLWNIKKEKVMAKNSHVV